MNTIGTVFLILAFFAVLYILLLLFLPMRIHFHGLFSLEDIWLTVKFRPVLFPCIKIHSDKILAWIGRRLRQEAKKENAAQISAVTQSEKNAEDRIGLHDEIKKFTNKIYKPYIRPHRQAFRKMQKKVLRHLNKLLCKTATEKFSAEAWIGLQDAAATAIASGIAYGLLSLPLISVRKPKQDADIRINVTPQYGTIFIKIQAEGIFTLLPVHIIGVIIACFGRLLAFAGTVAVNRLRAKFTHFMKRKEA